MRCVLSSLLVFSFTASALAQAPIVPNPAQQQGPSVTTIHAAARLVLVDVVVTDKEHRAVHNLKAGDFTLLESGTPQTFKNFEEHIAPTAADALKLTPVPKLPPGIFTNFGSAPAGGPLNILLLDRLNTPVESQAQVQQQINEYLRTYKPGTRIAVFGLTDKLTLLQGFTSDPEILKSVFGKNGNLRASPLLQDAVGGSSTQQTQVDMMTDTVAELTGDQAGTEEAFALFKQFETQNASFQVKLRAQYTLDAMNLLARYLTAFPGRKNLLWFSGSFPINIEPDSDPNGGGTSKSFNNDPFAGVITSEKEFRQTTALLSRSQVAVYPINATGLTTYSAFQSSTASSAAEARPGGGGMRSALQKEEQQSFNANSTMYEMANDTGGVASINTNGLAKSVNDDIENGSNYYTIAYSPTNPDWNGTFRSIQVKLNQQGYNLSYRRGYFADDPDELGKFPSGTAVATPAFNAMKLALIHGGPPVTQVVFSTRVLPIGTTTDDTVAPGNRLGKDAKGPYRRYRVEFAIAPSQISFTQTPDGNRHETIEFVTFVYNNDGSLIDSINNSIQANVIPAAYEQFLRTGVPYAQTVSVPAKGEYYLRIAVRDVQADHVGAIEIPVASVRNLPALPAAVSPSAPAPR